MQVGDFGWGATIKEDAIKETDFGINKRRTFGVFYHDSDAKNTPNGHQYGGGIFFGRDPAVSTHMLYSPDWSNRLYMRSPKSASTMNPWVEFYSTENAVTDRNGLLRISANDELSDNPVGAPIPWPQATAPSGFLVCNGQSFNKTTYPLLAKAYPTGVLPDLRGEFLRGLDAGRGVDSGRAVLSAQGDAFRAHNHSVIGEDSGSGTAYFGRGNGSRRSITKDAMNLEGGTETRPRNIAFLYIVRAA
ncbi:tail fiber protein [Providencia rettgeri]|nr:tail fiber protein [Providencia rettgeri]